MRSFIKVVDKANKALEVLAGLALAGMTGLIFLQVLVRFVFAKLQMQLSVPWTEELSRYLMIWAIFIGAAVVARRADALAVEALVQAVPAWIGRKIKVCAHLLALAFYVCVFWVGWQWAEFGLTESAPVLGVPMVWVYASMSVGAVLTMVNAVVLLAEIWLERKDILDVIDAEMEEALHDAELVMAGNSKA